MKLHIETANFGIEDITLMPQGRTKAINEIFPPVIQGNFVQNIILYSENYYKNISSVV